MKQICTANTYLVTWVIVKTSIYDNTVRGPKIGHIAEGKNHPDHLYKHIHQHENCEGTNEWTEEQLSDNVTSWAAHCI